MSLLARMIEAGVPADIIEDVAMLVAEKRAAEKAIEDRRTNEAARTRGYRQRGGGQVSPQLRHEILERDGFACLECGSDDRLEIDHIIPLAKGGDPVHPDNLQTLCRPCNARKRDRIRNADKRGKMRTSAESEEVHTYPSLSLPPNENNSNPPTHTHPDITTRARETDPFPRPEWCDPQVWRDLKANRKAKRLPCTPTAHAKLMRDIEKLVDDEWPPGRLLEAIVARGWAAAYDPRDDRKPANDRQRTQFAKPTTREIGERVAAELAARRA